MKNNKDIILIFIMIVIEIILGIYGLLNGFNALISVSMILIAVGFIALVYYLNHKDNIYSGKFKDHFGD